MIRLFAALTPPPEIVGPLIQRQSGLAGALWRPPEALHVTLRFFGADAVYDERPGRAGPRVSGFHDRLRQGEPFRDPSFPRLLPAR